MDGISSNMSMCFLKGVMNDFSMILPISRTFKFPSTQLQFGEDISRKYEKLQISDENKYRIVWTTRN